jgi:hypothetical protein
LRWYTNVSLPAETPNTLCKVIIPMDAKAPRRGRFETRPYVPTNSLSYLFLYLYRPGGFLYVG